MTTIQDLRQKAQEYADRTHDALLPASLIKMNSAGQIVTFGRKENLPLPATPNRHAFGHLVTFFKGTRKYPIAENIGRATDHYFYDMDDELRAINVNHWLNKLGNKELRWRGYDRDGGGEGLELRAVCSSVYGIVDHHHILDAIAFSFQGRLQDIEVQHVHMNDEIMHLRLSFPGSARVFEFDRYRSVYQAGLYISNGTVKNRSIVVAPYIQSTACRNSTIFASDFGLNRSHSGATVLSARNAIYEMAGVALGHTQEAMEKLFDAALVDVPSPVQMLDHIMDSLGVKDENVRQSATVGMFEQGGTNLFGLSNGLSYAAQKAGDEELRVKIEMASADVIMADPDDLFGRLARLEHAFAETAS